jgi:hypothetical protein
VNVLGNKFERRTGQQSTSFATGQSWTLLWRMSVQLCTGSVSIGAAAAGPERRTARVVNVCYKISGRGVPIFAFANNHFAGNGPATVRVFQELWREHPESMTRAKRPENLSLF